MKITRFEDIEAWKAARKLMNTVYKITRLSGFKSDQDLVWQMRRAADSSMSNIAEGFDSGSDREFSRFLKIARRSSSEQQSHLYVALDQGYIERAEFDFAYAQAQEVKRLIFGFLRYLLSATSSGAGDMIVRDAADSIPDECLSDGEEEEGAQ